MEYLLTYYVVVTLIGWTESLKLITKARNTYLLTGKEDARIDTNLLKRPVGTAVWVATFIASAALSWILCPIFLCTRGIRLVLGVS